MTQKRVAAFIDGFNLYHAIHDLGRNELKWLDLRALMECYIDPAVHSIGHVYYFTAYANWLTGPFARHQQYVRALMATGVTPVMGKFKEKTHSCKSCKAAWMGHEEKESDVNIAVWMLRESFDDTFDQAFLVTGDSDLSPPLRFIRQRFPNKEIKVIAPPGRFHSKQLWAMATHRASIKVEHIERCLFPQSVTDTAGNIAAARPQEYDPPSPPSPTSSAAPGPSST